MKRIYRSLSISYFSVQGNVRVLSINSIDSDFVGLTASVVSLCWHSLDNLTCEENHPGRGNRIPQKPLDGRKLVCSILVAQVCNNDICSCLESIISIRKVSLPARPISIKRQKCLLVIGGKWWYELCKHQSTAPANSSPLPEAHILFLLCFCFCLRRLVDQLVVVEWSLASDQIT